MIAFPFGDLRRLKPNWDSYGGKPPDEKTIHRASDIWHELSGEWDVVPMSDGGIQIEQHCDGFDIEITVRPAGNNGESQ